MSISSGSIASYKYDGQHRRFRKIVDDDVTTYITAASGQVLSEYTQDSLATDYIYLNGRPLAKITSTGEKLYFINDHLGTPLVLVDSAKTVRWSADWYPFGEIYDEQVSATNNVRFPGQWRDAGSELYYNWHRYYNPAIGRYMQADPVGLLGGMNQYSYVSGNPIGWIDINGLVRICVKTRMLVTAYNDIGPGSDWPYYKPKKPGGEVGKVGPGTVAVANPNNPKTGKPYVPARPVYPYGSTVRVIGPKGEVLYEGVVHDTGRGFDQAHHNVAPNKWIDIWLPGKEANKWGKQWRQVEICYDKDDCE